MGAMACLEHFDTHLRVCAVLTKSRQEFETCQLEDALVRKSQEEQSVH